MPLLPFQFVRYSQATNIATFHAAREGGSRQCAYSKYVIQPWMKNIHGKIVVSFASLRMISRHFDDPFQVIPNGVECAQFAEATPLPEYLDGKRNILYLGRLEKRRGIEGRADDDPAAVRRRLEAYRAQTAPVLDWYEARGGVTRIPAVGTVDAIAGRVRAALGA